MWPILFESNLFTLYSYPLFMGFAWGFGYFFTNSIFEKYNLDASTIKSLFIGLFLSSWIGAKVFFLWFSSGPKLYQYIYANYFWLGGGFVFYGGLIFGLLFYFIWSLGLKKFDFSKSKYLLPGLIFGHAIGRVGCLLTGCCYGAKTNSFFSIYIQNERRIPVQGFEALALLIIGFVILKMLKDQKANQFIIQSYLISYSIIRFFLEYFRGDEIRGVFFQYTSTSQLISIIIIVTILIKKIFLKNETA